MFSLPCGSERADLKEAGNRTVVTRAWEGREVGGWGEDGYWGQGAAGQQD